MPIRLPFTSPAVSQQGQNPLEHLSMRFHIDQPPCPRDGRVVGRSLVQQDSDELSK
jgi:hypothetical protein